MGRKSIFLPDLGVNFTRKNYMKDFYRTYMKEHYKILLQYTK